MVTNVEAVAADLSLFERYKWAREPGIVYHLPHIRRRTSVDHHVKLQIYPFFHNQTNINKNSPYLKNNNNYYSNENM